MTNIPVYTLIGFGLIAVFVGVASVIVLLAAWVAEKFFSARKHDGIVIAACLATLWVACYLVGAAAVNLVP